MKAYADTDAVPMLGVEAEIAGWHPPTNADKATSRLVKTNRMPTKYEGPVNHKWHCDCETCAAIGRWAFNPVQWKRQNDGTLPPTGAEFISSRFPAVQPFINDVVLSLTTLGQNAYGPELEFIDKYGRPSEVGIHVHASVNLSKAEMEKGALRDVVRTCYLFYPELVRLASSAGRQRSLQYRWPKYDLNKHHNFLTVATGPQPHLEWRLWESQLDDEAYLRGVLWTSAVLTRLLKLPKVLFTMEAIGQQNRWDLELSHNFYKADPRDQESDGQPFDPRCKDMLEFVAGSFDPYRFDALRAIVLKEVQDSDDLAAVELFFARAE